MLLAEIQADFELDPQIETLEADELRLRNSSAMGERTLMETHCGRDSRQSCFGHFS
jgi:hypothetical protein